MRSNQLRSEDCSALRHVSQPDSIDPQFEADSSMSLSNSAQVSNQCHCRCLNHCWLTAEEREQGRRCLVACWCSH